MLNRSITLVRYDVVVRITYANIRIPFVETFGLFRERNRRILIIDLRLCTSIEYRGWVVSNGGFT